MPLRTAIIGLSCFGILAAVSAPAVGGPPLALHPENPHYFLFRGKPTVLVSSGEHYGAVLNLDFDYVRYLDELHARGLNHTRTWAGTYREVPGSFNIKDNTLAPRPGRYLAPWARSATPGYSAGGNQFDLARWDEAFFDRLKDFVARASERGIVVELDLFCPNYDDAVWKASPLNAINNVNGVGACPREEVYTLKHAALLAIEEATAREIVRRLAGSDNVYFEVCNEPYFAGVAIDWQYRIADVIVETEKNSPDKHLISMNYPLGKVERPHPAVSILNFHYAAPPDVVALNYGLNRAIGENETGFKGRDDATYRTEGWDFLLAGGALYNNLDYSFTVEHPDGNFLGHDAPGGGSPRLRRELTVLKDFLDGFAFVRMAPDQSVIKGGIPAGATVRALVERGRQYAVYIKGGTRADLRLELPAGLYAVEWVGTLKGDVVGSEKLDHPGGVAVLRSPKYERDMALRVRTSR